MLITRDRIIEVAKSQIGEKESPANSNGTKYGEWYGMNFVAWCAIFVSWVFNEAGIPLPKIDTKKGYHYVPTLYFRAKLWGYITLDPQPGDIVLFDWNGDKAADHTGIFEKWLDKTAGKFQCIEGNTAHGNDSNGGQVMERPDRNIHQVLAFVSASIAAKQPA